MHPIVQLWEHHSAEHALLVSHVLEVLQIHSKVYVPLDSTAYLVHSPSHVLRERSVSVLVWSLKVHVSSVLLDYTVDLV